MANETEAGCGWAGVSLGPGVREGCGGACGRGEPGGQPGGEQRTSATVKAAAGAGLRQRPQTTVTYPSPRRQTAPSTSVWPADPHPRHRLRELGHTRGAQCLRDADTQSGRNIEVYTESSLSQERASPGRCGWSRPAHPPRPPAREQPCGSHTRPAAAGRGPGRTLCGDWSSAPLSTQRSRARACAQPAASGAAARARRSCPRSARASPRSAPAQDRPRRRRRTRCEGSDGNVKGRARTQARKHARPGEVPRSGRSQSAPSRGKGGAFGVGRGGGVGGSPTVAAEGRRYGAHAGPNAAGRRAREPRALRGALGPGRVSGRDPQSPRRRHHAAALLLEPRVRGGPAGPAARTAGLPRRRRGEGTW